MDIIQTIKACPIFEGFFEDNSIRNDSYDIKVYTELIE